MLLTWYIGHDMVAWYIARKLNLSLLQTLTTSLSTMPRPCGAIDCGYVVISTNHCKTFRLASGVTVERVKHIFWSHQTGSLKDFLTAKHQVSRQNLRGLSNIFRGGKSLLWEGKVLLGGTPCSRKADFKPNKSFKLGQIWRIQLYSWLPIRHHLH